jgi:hypothetical protein
MARPLRRSNALDPTDDTTTLAIKLPRNVKESALVLAEMRGVTLSQLVRDLLATAIDRAIAAIVDAPQD